MCSPSMAHIHIMSCGAQEIKNLAKEGTKDTKMEQEKKHLKK